MQRRICYLTGTRADFGLMAMTLKRISIDPRFELKLLVTGTHLSSKYGNTINEIEALGFDIAASIHIDLNDTSGASMALNIGHMITGLVSALKSLKPDVLLLLGDRGEMLAGAIAAIHLGIPIAHIHGGERSGTVDEPVRHAISKLAHIHLVATCGARDRLIRMGEQGANVHLVGAPGLDGLLDEKRLTREELCQGIGFDHTKNVGMLVFHPVLQEEKEAAQQIKEVLEAAKDMQVLALMPNSDAGSNFIRDELTCAQSQGNIVLRTHLPRDEYLGWLACCDVLFGNSSSGIIEAATFGTPVVNVGSRQNLRERNRNVIDVSTDMKSIRQALENALTQGKFTPENIYGDGTANERIVEILANCSLGSTLLSKSNAY